MPTNLLNLDVTRKRLDEPMFAASRVARHIDPPQNGKNLCYYWPGAQSWTLQPINVLPEFRETANWEGLKFRLSDCINDGDWSAEVPENVALQSDYFITAVVKNANLPAGFPYPTSGTSHNLLNALVDVVAIAAASELNYENVNGVNFLQSKQSLPPNQGYCLRFHIHGKGSEAVSAIYEFYFGDFMVRLNSDGIAEL